MAALRFLKLALLLCLLGGGALLGFGYIRSHPEDLPWTEVDLGQPIGAFTGRKLAALSDDAPRCRALLGQAGIRHMALPPLRASRCGYDDAVRFRQGGAIGIAYRPADLGIACPVAAALGMWEWNVVQPAALAHLGQKVERIEHLGSYSCRRLYGRPEGDWSEHATANAIDVAAFRLEDGTRISLVDDWRGDNARSRFLRQVRDGACKLFATVLSPDYNRAHRDHLHFDQAARGALGWRGCR